MMPAVGKRTLMETGAEMGYEGGQRVRLRKVVLIQTKVWFSPVSS